MFFNVKLKLLRNFNFSQFQELLSFSKAARTQDVLKIGAFKHLAILKIQN